MLIERYAKSRSYLYHLTHRDNLNHIREMRRLFPAAILMEQSGNIDLMRTPRRRSVALKIDERQIVLRDQIPLYEGMMQLPIGYTFAEFVESLNRRIFFWPGNKHKPKDNGLRHFEHYKEEKPVIVRAEFEALCRMNPAAKPLFCRYNSGSPRVTYKKKSPRGPNTFLPAEEFNGTPSTVVEVTFDVDVVLPGSAEFSFHPFGPWHNLLQ